VVHPLLEPIERSGVTTERVTQAINATLAGPEAAAALEPGARLAARHR
jgi:GntR family transcriptional regulator